MSNKRQPASQEINPAAVQVLAERGVEITEALPNPLTGDVVRAADVIGPLRKVRSP